MLSLGICDDEVELITSLAAALGYEKDLHIRTWPGPVPMLKELLKGNCAPDVLLLDVRMPEMDGLTALGELRKVYPHLECAVLMLTAESDTALVKRAAALAISGWIVKPHDLGDLVDRVRRACPMEPALSVVQSLAGRCLVADPTLLSQMPPKQLPVDVQAIYPVKERDESWAIAVRPGISIKRLTASEGSKALETQIVAMQRTKSGWARAWPRRTLRPKPGDRAKTGKPLSQGSSTSSKDANAELDMLLDNIETVEG